MKWPYFRVKKESFNIIDWFIPPTTNNQQLLSVTSWQALCCLPVLCQSCVCSVPVLPSRGSQPGPRDIANNGYLMWSVLSLSLKITGTRGGRKQFCAGGRVSWGWDIWVGPWKTSVQCREEGWRVSRQRKGYGQWHHWHDVDKRHDSDGQAAV